MKKNSNNSSQKDKNTDDPQIHHQVSKSESKINNSRLFENNINDKGVNINLNKVLNKININLNAITIKVNPGVISEIYTHLLSTVSDFSGFLIGSVKEIKKARAMDSDSNYEKIEHLYKVNFVIMIHNTLYLETNGLKSIVEKIEKKYQNTGNELLGVFSARSYSYPNMSVKDQDVYKIVSQQTKLSPILFATFTYNISEITQINSVKSLSMDTRFFLIDYNKQSIETIPFEVINITDTTYKNIICHGSKKISNIDKQDFLNLEKPVVKLQSLLSESVDILEKKYQFNIMDIKQKLKSELDLTRELLGQLKNLEK